MRSEGQARSKLVPGTHEVAEKKRTAHPKGPDRRAGELGTGQGGLEGVRVSPPPSVFLLCAPCLMSQLSYRRDTQLLERPERGPGFQRWKFCRIPDTSHTKHIWGQWTSLFPFSRRKLSTRSAHSHQGLMSEQSEFS